MVCEILFEHHRIVFWLVVQLWTKENAISIVHYLGLPYMGMKPFYHCNLFFVFILNSTLNMFDISLMYDLVFLIIFESRRFNNHIAFKKYSSVS